MTGSRSARDAGPSSIVVLGAGVIGTSVAYACLQAGHDVVLVDRPGHDWTQVRRELRRQRRLVRLLSSDSPAPEVDELRVTDDLSVVRGALIVIENVSEDLDTKREVYEGLRGLLPADSYVFANTSAIAISRLAALSADPARTVGVHFMNPVPAIDLVEMVRARQTSAQTIDAANRFLASMGKRAVVVEDSPGFVINRILMIEVNEAAKLVEEGVASAHDVDQLFKGCLGHRMGPARTGDLIGLDTVLNTLSVLEAQTGDVKFRPAASLVRMVEDGRTGMKSGHGFYDYSTEVPGV